MIQQLKTCVALAEGLNSASCTHTVVQSNSGDLTPSSDHQEDSWYTYRHQEGSWYTYIHSGKMLARLKINIKTSLKWHIMTLIQFVVIMGVSKSQYSVVPHHRSCQICRIGIVCLPMYFVFLKYLFYFFVHACTCTWACVYECGMCVGVCVCVC